MIIALSMLLAVSNSIQMAVAFLQLHQSVVFFSITSGSKSKQSSRGLEGAIRDFHHWLW